MSIKIAYMRIKCRVFYMHMSWKPIIRFHDSHQAKERRRTKRPGIYFWFQKRFVSIKLFNISIKSNIYYDYFIYLLANHEIKKYRSLYLQLHIQLDSIFSFDKFGRATTFDRHQVASSDKRWSYLFLGADNSLFLWWT